jgi:hypothetical protein
MKPPCAIADCTRMHESRGLCGKHYQALVLGRTKKKDGDLVLRHNTCGVTMCYRKATRNLLCRKHWKVVRKWAS